MTEIIIVGCGPVGLACALLLVNECGFTKITIYEGRRTIPNDPEESYPIGINPRALHCLARIDPQLAERAKQSSLLVDAWHIYGGKSKVADLKSGTVYGTTRGDVNSYLYDHAVRCPAIKIVFDHKFVNINFGTKQVIFATSAGEVVVDASAARVFAADGVYSGVRRAMEAAASMDRGDGTFSSEVTPWRTEHRVLWARPHDPNPPGLDPAVHYIFSGFYAATVRRGDGRAQWTLVTGVFDRDPQEDKDLLLSNEASDSNVKKLKEMIAARVSNSNASPALLLHLTCPLCPSPRGSRRP